jgi:hypothetical protein
MIISYATKGIYEEILNTHLLPTLKKYNLKYDIEIVENFKSWQSNTYFKATFIRNKLLQYKKDLIWIDVDATIEKYPTLLYNIPQEYDIALFYLDWYLHWRNKPNQIKRELISATMFFRYKPRVINLLNAWIKSNKKRIDTGVWEQKVFQDVLKQFSNIKIYYLPVEYCAIEKHDKTLPTYIKDPVIIQHQCSRWCKYKVKNE